MVFAWSFAQPGQPAGGVNGNVIDGENGCYLPDGFLQACFSCVISHGAATAFSFISQRPAGEFGMEAFFAVEYGENRNQPSPSGGTGSHSVRVDLSSQMRSSRSPSRSSRFTMDTSRPCEAYRALISLVGVFSSQPSGWSAMAVLTSSRLHHVRRERQGQ